MQEKNKPYVAWFSKIGKEDIPLVGGKGANLGEMTQAKIPVPPGFIVTAPAYYHFIEVNSLKKQIHEILHELDANNTTQLSQASRKVKDLILHAPIPSDIARQIIDAYMKLSSLFSDALVAVRSSATAEDLPDASFAGQQATFLNVKGESNVVQAVRQCWASLFEERALFYRAQHHFDHFKVGIAVPVQKMVQSDVSGVMFTINPTTNDKNHIIIESVYGLGETIVQGSVNPDHYEVDKKTVEIVKKELSTQKKQLVLTRQGNREIPVAKAHQSKQKLSDALILEVARLGKKIEAHYYFPQDIEWAVEKGKVFIVQSRPVTTMQQVDTVASYKGPISLPILLKGAPASPGIGFGSVRIIHSKGEMGKIRKGDVLVTEMTTPDFVPAMKKAAAIVTDLGGRTCHAAIVSRELGLPCVVGANQATKKLVNGMVVTVNGTTGDVYKGALPIESKNLEYAAPKIVTSGELKTATKVYVNLAEPERAQEIAALHVDGVGLLRAEFMIAQLGVHPKKLIRDKKEDRFIRHLSSGIGEICKAFHPRPVVYRATDFKTNEYRNLAGGKEFEPQEPNPMLGYRGCYRYINDPALFQLELDAIKIVRNKMNLKNLWLMIPFVRTVRELEEVKKIIAASGLSRSVSFKLWMMVEIPSNIILLDKFIEIGIDGISIGTNDLTMLLLGTDRDNDEVAKEFDERDPAVEWAIEKAIKTAHKFNITSSVCGQAPSVFPEITQLLVRNGVTSISVSPDAIQSTRELVHETEKKLSRGKK